jgi:nitronate monooxygenase
MGETAVPLWEHLRLPLMAAPMFIVSNPELVIACCRAGVIGAFPAANPRAPDSFETWLETINAARARTLAQGGRFVPYCVNLLLAGDQEARAARLQAARAAKVPLILTNLGDPTAEVAAAHTWGARVLHDVTTMRHAEKAIAAGVDGLMLVCGGAGGHAGTLNPFAFLPQVRRIFDGLIVLAGGIADGPGIAAALTLGADMVAMGTRFIATRESGTFAGHKQMLVEARSEDVIFTDAIAGMPASFLRQSIAAAGLDPVALPPPLGRHRPDLPPGVKAWKTVWSGGHSTGLIDDVPSVSELVERLANELQDTAEAADWQTRLMARMKA